MATVRPWKWSPNYLHQQALTQQLHLSSRALDLHQIIIISHLYSRPFKRWQQQAAAVSSRSNEDNDITYYEDDVRGDMAWMGQWKEIWYIEQDWSVILSCVSLFRHFGNRGKVCCQAHTLHCMKNFRHLLLIICCIPRIAHQIIDILNWIRLTTTSISELRSIDLRGAMRWIEDTSLYKLIMITRVLTDAQYCCKFPSLS
jgi:hypothetical protein